MYFRNYGFSKTSLDKYVKSKISQYSSITNMINALKHCSNLDAASFLIFIGHCGEN